MIKDDKQRVIGKLISINSDKFTVELLNQSINFTLEFVTNSDYNIDVLLLQ